MDFIDQLKQFSSSVEQRMNNALTEEATKMSLIVPFFQLLGYDVFNPAEFCPEYTADVGIKKGEKVDYAILYENRPVILIECKSCTDALDKHGSQLFRYFGTSKAKFGILTNGIIYRFFTDLEESNKMDMTPFLEISMLDLRDNQIIELKKFCKTIFDCDKIFSNASELKYTNLIKEHLAKELDNPSDDFVKYILSYVYDGQKTQKVMDRYKPVVKKSFTLFINDIVNQKITSALSQDPESEAAESDAKDLSAAETKINTTQEELQSYYIIQAMLVGTIDINDITHRDTESYFGVLYQDNNRKPICRLNFDKKRKYVMIPDESKNYIKYYLDTISDLYTYKEKIIEVVLRYIE